MGKRSGLSLAFGLIGLLLVSAPGQASADDEQVCEVQRVALFDVISDRRDEGPETRRELLDRLRPLIGAFEASAPNCAGRLHEHAAFLYVLDARYDEVEARIAAYLAGAGQRTSARSKIVLHLQRGYALRQLGQIAEGAQATFRAAGLADRAPAAHGARALINAGYVARDLGEEGPAIDYFRAALRLIADSLGKDPLLPDLQGSALTSLSIVTDQQIERAGSDAERDSLIDLLDQRTAAALAVLSSEGQPAGHRAHVANLSALVAAWRGDFVLARERMRASPILARRAGVLMPLALWSTYLVEGRIAELAGDEASARAAYLRARAEAVRTEAVQAEAEALEYLGRLDERQQRWEAAAEHFQAAIERRELVRDRIGLDDWSASAFAQMQAPYRGLVRVRLAQGDAKGAFLVLDQTRARYLRDLRRHLAIHDGLRPETRRAVDSVAGRLSETRLAYLTTQTATARASLRQETSVLQKEIERLTAAPSDTAEITVDLPALQRYLGRQNRTLVSYLINEEDGTAFVVRADTLVAIPIPASRRRVREHLRAIGGPWNGRRTNPAFALPPLHALYQDLIAPIRPWVTAHAVTIIPDREIATAPFAIFLSAAADNFRTAPYLLRDWTLSTELSATLVMAPSPITEKPLDVLALGRRSFDLERSTWNTNELQDLPNVRREIRQVSRYGTSLAYEDREATEARFREAAADARVIHIASHAEARSELPLYSRIALQPGSGDDGTLHLYELLNTAIDADLVVLSGCSTANGGALDGEGVIGLQYGMRAAGATATLSTLWPIADDAAAEVMGSFYAGLNDGLGKDEALRRAQLTYLAAHDGLEASPFYWAAPVLSGNPAPIPFTPRMPWRWVTLFVVTGLGAWVAWRLRFRPANA